MGTLEQSVNPINLCKPEQGMFLISFIHRCVFSDRRTCPMPWTRPRSQTSWLCTPCATVTGTSRLRVPPVEMVSMRVWTGSQASWKTQNDPSLPLPSVISVCSVTGDCIGPGFAHPLFSSLSSKELDLWPVPPPTPPPPTASVYCMGVWMSIFFFLLLMTEWMNVLYVWAEWEQPCCALNTV